MNDQILLEPDEKPVEEVRCSETGVPIPAIPAWYATVNVKFVSNAARKSNAPLGMGLDSETPRPEGESEPAIDELEIEEIEIEDEAEPDEE